MKTLSIEQMEETAAGWGNRASCIVGAATLIGGLIGTALCPPAGTLLGALWVGGFLGDVTNTTFACAQWLAGE